MAIFNSFLYVYQRVTIINHYSPPNHQYHPYIHQSSTNHHHYSPLITINGPYIENHPLSSLSSLFTIIHQVIASIHPSIHPSINQSIINQYYPSLTIHPLLTMINHLTHGRRNCAHLPGGGRNAPSAWGSSPAPGPPSRPRRSPPRVPRR